MTNPDEAGDAPQSSAPAKPRRVGRIIGRTLLGIVAGLLVVVLIAAGFGVWTIARSFPTYAGEVTVEGLDDPVTIQRDALGVPTITADSTHDLFFAQGYAHAQDRFWEMDFRRHVTSARLSEIFGESQLPTDRFLRTLGWHRIAEEEVEALDPTVRSYYDDYAAGVNAYIGDRSPADLSLEYSVLALQNGDYEVEPWTAADSVAWLKAMAWDLRENIDTEIDRAILAQEHDPAEIAELYPTYPYELNPVIVPTIAGTAATTQPASAESASGTGKVQTASFEWREVGSVVEAASALLGGAGEGIGSNSWVVSGALTATGAPLLSNDPHLGASLPSVWHQVGLRCSTLSDSCPFDVSGFSFSGVPGVVIGHNDRVAWGFTNLTTDVADLYVEKVDGDQYWRDGALVDLETRTETIKVAGGDDETLEVRSTVHGPLLTELADGYTSISDDPVVGSGVDASLAAPDDGLEGEYEVSLSWTALVPGTTAASIFALNVAQDWEGFRLAASQFDVPAQNLIYADVDGNIGYQAPGKLPIRGAGDGSVPQPGWDSAFDWKGSIPFADLPTVLNPAAGYIVTANNAIVGTEYPYFLTNDWDYGWRAARITELLDRAIAAGKVTAADMRAIQSDDQFWMGKRLASVLAGIDPPDDATAAALDLLTDWDAQTEIDSAPAAYANVLWATLVHEVFTAKDASLPVAGQGRLFLVVDRLLEDPASTWWDSEDLDIAGRDEMLAHVAQLATQELTAAQGDDPERWNWGDLHAITLTNDTFGTSGIAPIEWLFNRGPFAVSGGASVVNATGWELGGRYETTTVPSMRMVIDLSDFDASSWNHLTGTSGHAFHPNYIDQFPAWQAKDQTPWPYSDAAIDAATRDTLVLNPAG